MSERCETCRHFNIILSDDLEPLVAINEFPGGECRRHAPSGLAGQCVSRNPFPEKPIEYFVDQHSLIIATWPLVSEDWGCGEYEERGPE